MSLCLRAPHLPVPDTARRPLITLTAATQSSNTISSTVYAAYWREVLRAKFQPAMTSKGASTAATQPSQ
jgi:hypothetical protein